jgi:hypothetical protein
VKEDGFRQMKEATGRGTSCATEAAGAHRYASDEGLFEGFDLFVCDVEQPWNASQY